MSDELTRRLRELSPEKQARLLQRLGKAPAADAQIPRRAANDRAPLSFAQERLWLLHRLEPHNALYCIPAVVRLDGKLDEPALARSFAALAARHESLRTVFEEQAGVPVQRILAEAPVLLATLPLSEGSLEARRAEAMRLADREARASFDLERGPLCRARLLPIAPDEHLLVLATHHIVSDGWSIDVFVRELTQLYDAFAQGRAPALAAEPLQYGDVVEWERRTLVGPRLETQLSYWRERLTGAAPVLALPSDRARPALPRFRGASHARPIPAPLWEALEALGKEERCTQFMVLLAGVQAVLGRYAGQDDVLVGTPVANRDRVETEGVIGLFVNMLVIRTDLSGSPSFRALLARVREAALGAYAHPSLPFARLVSELNPERAIGQMPIFQVPFSVREARLPGLHLTGLGLTQVPLEPDPEAGRFDVSVMVEDDPRGRALSLLYNPDLFDAATIARLADHMVRFLEEAVAHPDRPVDRAPLLSQAERQRIVTGWNDTRVAFDGGWCLHQLVSAQAQRTPDAVAVAAGPASLSYAELDRRANQLARHLIRRGVGRDGRVALLVERSVDQLVGVLGAWKAGAAYVPLDPSSPRDRVALMLEDAGAAVLVSAQRLAERIALPAGVTLIQLDTDADAIAAEGAEDPLVSVSPANLAYVIYTSGSTGRPKGVLVEHRSAVNLVHALGRAIYAPLAGERLRVSLNAPLAFDASVKQLVLLVQGHALYVVPASARTDGRALLAYIREHAIDVLDCTPSHLELLLPAGLLDGGPAPRLVLVGGEPIAPELWATLAAAPATEFVNVYGPTECTVDVSAQSVRAAAAPTIGRPLANVRCYVLDRHLEPAPIGVLGELYVGGAGLARGYHARPDATAEKFVPNPFVREPGARMYRTGDLARFRSDGSLELAGRADDQVKLRGFRIELGDIEAALAGVPGVREAAVVVRSDEPGERRLVGYVVLDAGVAAAAAREALKERLPYYMVPAVLVALPALPLSPNGKVDRRALPIPPADLARAAPAPEQARSPEEEVLLGVWGEILRTEKLTVSDVFFDVGGDSLLATLVMSRIRELFDIELPLAAMFERPTIAGLADELAKQRPGGGAPIVRAPRSGETPRFPCSFAQERLFFLEQFQIGSAFYNSPMLVALDGALDVRVLERCLREVVRRHEALRTVFDGREGRAEQIVRATMAVSLETTDLSALMPAARLARVRAETEADAERPFDLGSGPLLRTRLFQLSPVEHVFYLATHHIVSDGWSNGILLRETAALYDAFARGEPSPLPELAVQYADFACWQREVLSEATLEVELAYWRRKLAGAPALLSLPTDRPRPPEQRFVGAVEPVELPEPLLAGLQAVGQTRGATLYMTLLTAFSILLSRHSGQTDLVIGSPIANRTRKELEGLVGFFANTLAIRCELAGDPTFAELLEQVRASALEAYAHQAAPFEKVVEALAPERSLSHTPIFQAMLVLQNAPLGDLALPGLRLRPLPLHSGTARFDLVLNLGEREGKLVGEVEYSTDLFDRETIVRLLANLRTLLGGIVLDPERRLSELPLLDEAERARLLVEWNATPVEAPWRAATVDQLVDAQAEASPDAIAIVCGEERMSYGALDEAAGRLAAWLQAEGVPPDGQVGICLERSTAMVVAAVAIARAGAAAVPLDPAYPVGRLAQMLETGPLALVLTQASLRDRVPAGTRAVVLEELAPPPGRPRRCSRPGSIFYVIHTSGSTGRPKGVALPHSALVNLIEFQRATMAPRPRTLQYASLSFDVSFQEIFGTLAVGGTLHLIDEALRRDLPALGRFIDAHEVNRVHLPVVALQQLAEIFASEPGTLGSLRELVAAGEQLAISNAIVSLFERLADCTLYNHYGPAEVDLVTAYRFTGAPRAWPRQAPIGRPVWNSDLYVLDGALNPVPQGAVGELCLGAPSIARGYVGRAELTAERFVPNPWGRAPGARMYRTGDLVRWQGDGDLAYLGRSDHQIKLRGFRIELGEIEAALARHEAVDEVEVIVREDRAGDRRLVAYVVATERGATPAEVLRAHLRALVPEYMIPSAFVFLDALPLSPNGKVDRAALPSPELRGDARDYVVPLDEHERVLAQLWERLLGVSPVGSRDDFFALGGHSLLAMRLMAALKTATGRTLPVRALFERPTIEQLAGLLREQPRAGAESSLVAIQPRGSRTPLYCVHPGGGNVICYAELARLLGPEQPLFAFQARGIDDEHAPARTIEEMAGRYLDELRATRPNGPYLLLGWSMGGVVAHEMAVRLAAVGSAPALVVMLDTSFPVPRDAAAEREVLARFFDDLFQLRGRWRPPAIEATRPVDEALALILAEAQAAGALPADLPVAAVRRLFGVFQANDEASRVYRPPRYDGRVLLVAAEESPHRDAVLAGWRTVLGAVEPQVTAGDHYSLLLPPQVGGLAERLAAALPGHGSAS